MKHTLISIAAFVMVGHLLITIAAFVMVGRGESQQSAPPQAEPVEPAMPDQEILGAIKELETMVAVAEAAAPEPPSAKAPDIAIRKAVEAGNIEAVKQAVADGADVDSKNAEGQTPLCRAVQYGKKDVIKLLIEEGADVNARMNFGDTALDYANVSGGLGMSYEVQKEVVDILRKHGAKTGEELKAKGK